MDSVSRSRIFDFVTLLTAVCAIVLSTVFLWERATGRRVSLHGQGPKVTTVPEWRTFAADGHRVGNASAPVTLVVFLDYECPVCRRFHLALNAVGREFGDSVSFVYRHLPLTEIHPMAGLAARAVECASSQGRFMEYHEILLDRTPWLAMGYPEFERYAGEIGGLDSLEFNQCLFAPGLHPAVEHDLGFARALDLAQTPAFLVNERLYRGAPDSTALFDLIRRAPE